MSMVTEPSSTEIGIAVKEAVGSYLKTRRERVRPFAERHFSLRGAMRLNRRALGKDFLRTPANVAWAIPYLASRVGASVARRLGARRAADRIRQLPPGLKTDVEREVEWLIYSELLELPYVQGSRGCSRDALFEEILAHPTINGLLLPALVKLDELARTRAFRNNLEVHLRSYTASRTAAADLSGSLLNLAAGAAAFQQFTPGTVGMGTTAATALAQHLAVSNFALGPALGALYFGYFPASASVGLLVATTGGLVLALGVLTACAGLVTDPLQQALGLHQRRLFKLLDALENALIGEDRGLTIRDAYVARVFDLWDLLQTATRVVR